MKGDFKINNMTPEDIEEVYRIETESFSNPWPRGAFESDVRNRRIYSPVVRDENNCVVAYALLMIFAEEAHLANIAVDPKLRRHGIGTLLMDHLIETAESRDCRAMFLDVRPSNKSAVSMYEEKYDFEILYRRKGYYSNPPEDALVMVRPLGERENYG